MKIWLAGFLFLGLTLISTPSKAEVPVCKGTSVLEKERQRDPKGFAAAMQTAAMVPNGQAIFWRIEKPGTQKISWLFGTIHVTDPRVNALSHKASAAILKAKTIALELTDIEDKASMTKALVRNLRLTALEPGQNLWAMLGKEQAGVVKSLLKNRGLPAGLFAGMQPYIVAMMFAVPKCELARKKANLPVLDQALLHIGRKNNIPVVALETLKEQLQAFASMPMETQKAFLLQTAKEAQHGSDYLETMIQAYLQREMNLMFGMMEMQNKGGVNEHFTKILLRKRNYNMVERSLPLIEKGGVFIAVGALHLVGKEGLVALFEKQGYKLVPIN